MLWNRGHCKSQNLKKYNSRHDHLGKVIPWELCKRLKFDQTNKWYMLKQESVLKVRHKILWDFDISPTSDHTWVLQISFSEQILVCEYNIFLGRVNYLILCAIPSLSHFLPCHIYTCIIIIIIIGHCSTSSCCFGRSSVHGNNEQSRETIY